MSYESEYHRHYYWKNHERIRAQQREREKSPERKAKVRAWREANRKRLAESKKAYQKANPDRRTVWGQAYNRRLRALILDHYGRSCKCCGETLEEFLAIDHINGGGSKHKRSVGKGGAFYAWIRNNGFPNFLRVLCHNCNQSLGHYGYCPHGPIR